MHVYDSFVGCVPDAGFSFWMLDAGRLGACHGRALLLDVFWMLDVQVHV